MIYALIGSTVASALLTFLLTSWYKDALWENTINEVKIEAANVLIIETDKVLQQERLATAMVRELEATHDQDTQAIFAAAQRNHTLSKQLGGMRDPGRRASCPETVPTTPSTPSLHEQTPTGARLSGEAEAFLHAEGLRANLAALDAKTCYAHVDKLEAMFEVGSSD